MARNISSTPATLPTKWEASITESGRASFSQESREWMAGVAPDTRRMAPPRNVVTARICGTTSGARPPNIFARPPPLLPPPHHLVYAESGRSQQQRHEVIDGAIGHHGGQELGVR